MGRKTNDLVVEQSCIIYEYRMFPILHKNRVEQPGIMHETSYKRAYSFWNKARNFLFGFGNLGFRIYVRRHVTLISFPFPTEQDSRLTRA